MTGIPAKGASIGRELPPDVGRLLDELVAALARVVDLVGLYAAGSLGSGDYVAGVSDLDLVAVIGEPASSATEAELRRVHRALARNHRVAPMDAAKVQCYYVPLDRMTELSERHLRWEGGRLSRRPLTGIARAELTRTALTVTGPEPWTVFPPIDQQALADAVRRDLRDYWGEAVTWRTAWLLDLYVDLGLLTLPRARATLTDGRLMGKTEALGRLADFGVPPWLVDEITRRRTGHQLRLGPWHRIRRARTARRLVAVGITSLLADPASDRVALIGR
jgi:hypothetical protein